MALGGINFPVFEEMLLVKKTFYDHYIFEGTHKEIGQQHGEALREQISLHLQFILDHSCRQTGVKKENLLLLALEFEPYLQAYAPGFADELHGLADGAGIRYEEALLLQVRQETLYLHKASKEEMECTSFAIRPKITSTGKMYSGQNVDLSSKFALFTNIITFKVTGKPQVMMVTPAGQISYQGCNNQGMSINCTFLMSKGWKKGFPRYLISRLAMEQKKFSEARNVIEKIERSSSRNMLLCHKKGDIVNYETTASEFEAIVVQKPYYVHSNHFLNNRMLQHEKSTEYQYTNSLFRLERLNCLIEENQGRIDGRMIKTFMRDHENQPHSICMHPDYPNNRSSTFASIITNLSDNIMEVCRGNPCCSEYATYEFSL